jgi:hypothetical protein
MAFNDEEMHALAGSAIASFVPVGINALGIDSMVTDVADAVFEGDRSRAATWTGAAFALMGIGLLAVAIVGDGIDGMPGIVAVSLGMTHIALAVEIFMEGM